jgi:hypothetical protein
MEALISKPAHNSTYAKGVVSCFKDSFAGKRIFVFKSSFAVKVPHFG